MPAMLHVLTGTISLCTLEWHLRGVLVALRPCQARAVPAFASMSEKQGNMNGIVRVGGEAGLLS